MGIKKYAPYTPSRRYMSFLDNSSITSKPKVSSLLKRVSTKAGRNNSGKITSRHKESGAKKLYRIIDFKRRKFGVPGVVTTIEYDPYRNCNISLIVYKDGDKRYIIHPSGLKIGDVVCSASGEVDIKSGNASKLINIPLGTIIHNVELKPGKGAQIARSAGGYVQLIGKEGKYCIVRLPSGEVRNILGECMATIGTVGNEEYSNVVIGKAGRNRHRGIRPQTRGSAMNPIDHPHGGGEAKTNSSRQPVTPWGKPTKGYKTRKKKSSDRLIITRRKVR